VLQITHLHEIATEIKTCKERIAEIAEKHTIAIVDQSDSVRIQYFLHTLRVFETEILVQLKEWDRVLLLVDVRHYLMCL
jgi:hypothetical protein